MTAQLFSGSATRRVLAKQVGFVALLLASALAIAQQRPDAGQILEQTREPLRLPPPSEPVLPKPPEPKPALPPSTDLRVTVKQFTFTGNTIYSAEQLRSATNEFIGKELDFSGLNEAATQVRAYYRSRGYFLAQAYLPQQAIRDGVVEIGVIEGRVGEVELDRKPAVRISEGLLAGILGTHLKQGQIITETGLERPLLLINDLPGAQVTSEIRPSRIVGAADLRVNVDQTPERFNGFVDADNHGNRFTGEYRFGTNLNWNTPLGYGDQATLRAFVSDEGFWYTRFAYLVPVGYHGTRLGVSLSKFEYRLTKDFASLRANGEGEVKSIYAFHPFMRTRNTNLIAQLSYEDKSLVDRIGDTFQKRLISAWKAGVVGDFRDGVLGGGLNAYSLTYTLGNLGIEPAAAAIADIDPTSGRNTVGNFRKWNLDGRRLQRITENTSFLVAGSAQKGSKNLASAEKFSLGGPNGVRAYPVGEATADTAVLLTAELRYIVPRFKVFNGDFTVSAFYDYGEARINENPILPADSENSRVLSGYGFGLSAGREGDFIVRAGAAWKTSNDEPQADRAQRVPRVWVQAIKWF